MTGAHTLGRSGVVAVSVRNVSSLGHPERNATHCSGSGPGLEAQDGVLGLASLPASAPSPASESGPTLARQRCEHDGTRPATGQPAQAEYCAAAAPDGHERKDSGGQAGTSRVIR